MHSLLLRVIAMAVTIASAFAAPAMASSPSVAPRTVSVDDPAPVQQPASGTVPVVFTVTLSGPALLAGEHVSVQFLTADYCGTGLPYSSSAHYQAVDTNLAFVANGPRAQSVTVLVSAGPDTGSARERASFSAQLSHPVGAVSSKAVGVGTLIHGAAIHDDPFFFDACLSKVRWGSLPPG